jgi:uncharacterized protein
MYVLAAGSGSPVFGALALFFFGLGTLPVMLGFSYVSTVISRAMATRITRYSGVLVVLLGLVMINNAFVLFGFQFANGGSDAGGIAATASAGETILSGPGNDTIQVIVMNVTRYGWQPDTFVLKRGVPVKWIINGQEITGCNNEIIVREYGLDIKLKRGEQAVEFTPERTGTVSWSCWMGMIPGRFLVVEGDSANTQAVEELGLGTEPGESAGGSCGISDDGGCGGIQTSGLGPGYCDISSGGSAGSGGCGCGCGGR